MATAGVQHQLRRGTTAQINAFTGAQGEVVFDTTLNRLVANDGVTPGGYPHSVAATQVVLNSSTTTILNNTTVVLCFQSTAALQVNLPSAAAYAPGQRLTVFDAGGSAATQNITVHVSTIGTDLIYTSAGGTTDANLINIAGGHAEFISNSSAHWMVGSTV